MDASPYRQVSAAPTLPGVAHAAWRDGDGHRLLPRHLYVEILDESGKRCAPGVPGEITVTCGENAAPPLLRYRTGDHAALVAVLVGLEGRAPVRLRAEHGGWVNSIELTHVLSTLGLVAWQLHQHADGRLSPRRPSEACWAPSHLRYARPTWPAMPSPSAIRPICPQPSFLEGIDIPGLWESAI